MVSPLFDEAPVAHAVRRAPRHGEEQSRAAFEASPFGMIIAGADGRFERVNPAFARMLGRTAEELHGRDHREFTHPEDLAAGSGDTIGELEKRFLRPDGTAVWARVTITAITGADGRERRLVQAEDITARKDAEAHAARETDRLRTIITIQREVAAASADRDTALRLVVRRAMEALPAAEGSIIGMIDGDELYPAATYGTLTARNDMRVRVDSSLAGRVVTTGRTLRCDDIGTDTRVDQGNTRSAGVRSMIIAPLFADGHVFGTLGVCSGRPYAFDDADTEQLTLLADALTGALRANAAVAALEISENRFRSAFDNSPLGMVLTGLRDDNLGVVLRANPAMAAITGYPVEQLAGMRVRDFHHPDEHADTDRVLDELRRPGCDTYTVAKRYRHADGHTLWVQVHTAVIRDEQGIPLYVVAQVQDVTDQRRTEQALADRNRELEGANHLKQDLMGMLGHEIGNPLTCILGNIEVFADSWDDLSAARQRSVLTTIGRNAHLIDGIVHEVLTLVTLDAGQITATPEPVGVHEHLTLAMANAGTSARLDCPDGVTAWVQPGHLAQIVTNLLSNARKYGGGATTLTAGTDGPTVRIAVHDAGPGVPGELRPHLFERFSRALDTTKTVKGTGLGLYIVRELARANGGDVHYEPAPGGGSIFVLTLPAWSGAA
jgi:PAS domain S-box-containing protein